MQTAISPVIKTNQQILYALLLRERHDPALVKQQRVCVAHVLCGEQRLFRLVLVRQDDLFHADEHERHVRARVQPRARRVRGDRMLVLAFERERVRERDPRRREARVHERRLGEVRACLLVLVDAHVPDAHGVPRDRVLGLALDELVREEEELWVEVREVVHAGDVKWHRVFVHADEAEDSVGGRVRLALA